MRANTIRTTLKLCALVALTLAAVALPAPGPAEAEGLQAAVVTTGDRHTCALSTTGGLKCWGSNWNGQLGDDTRTDRPIPTDAHYLTSDVFDVSAGSTHTCAIIPPERVICWGENYAGKLGDGTTINRARPTQVVGLTSGMKAIAAGWLHNCALTAAGTVKCWGAGWKGQLGDGTLADRYTPVDVCADAACTEPLSGITAIAVGALHTCAVTTSGGVKCWGWYNKGAFEDEPPDHIPQTTPIDVCADEACTENLSGVTAITAGLFFTCALLDSGGVKCWGINSEGQLGDGTTTDHFVPADVPGLTSGVVAIASGGISSHTCAITTENTVKCWGLNSSGQLGDGTTADRLIPVDVVTELGGPPLDGVVTVAPGRNHTCAVTVAGGVKCWGYNYSGQLGDGRTGFDSDSTTPVDVVAYGTPFPDTDQDGCADKVEMGTDAAVGGARDPLNFWDFFDMWTESPPERDGTVTISDILAVVQRFGAGVEPPPTEQDALAEALTSPPPAPAYHASFDRGDGSLGTTVTPPDGVISIGDIGAVVSQFGDSCL